MGNKTPGGKQKILVLEKAFRIQELMAKHPKGITLTEIAETLRMNRSTVFRILDTLKGIGYLIQDLETSRYRIGYKYFLFTNAASKNTMIELAHPFLEEFARQVDEVCHLSIRDGDEGIIIDRVQGKESGVIRISSYVGMRFVLHASAQGKILLSAMSDQEVDGIINRVGLPAQTPNTITDPMILKRELEIIRQRGYSVADMEVQENVRCVGVPIYNAEGKIAAALSLSGTEFSVSRERLPELSAVTREWGCKISQALGYYDDKNTR